MIVFLEGLPGVGKTTLVNYIKNLNLDNVHVVDEIVIKVKEGDSQTLWLLNDETKINMYNDGLIIIDRGLISTLSYNETLDKIKGNKYLPNVYNFFNKYKYLYDDSITYYLKRNNDNYYIPFDDINNPYGSIDNQKLLEEISLNNCNKYCKNLKIINYEYNKKEELADEIINKYMRS